MLLYKFRSLASLDNTIDILTEERLFCAPYWELNDPFEGFFDHVLEYPEEGGDIERICALSEVEDLLDPEDPIPRVCSLTQNPHDVRLWGHYAGSCRGVAIEIDFAGIEPSAQQVTYSQSIPIFSHNGYHPSIGWALTKKTEHWRYEHEYRILADQQYFNIKGRIRRIVVGHRCKPEHRRAIEKVAPQGASIVNAQINRANVTVIF